MGKSLINPQLKVLIIGGPDVDARIALMHHLKDRFEIGAIGSNPSLSDKFRSEGFAYHNYHLSRRLNPLSDILTFIQLIMILRRSRPEIVHAFDTKPGVWGCLAARVTGVPVIVCTSTGLGSLYDGDSLLSKFGWFFYKKLQTLASQLSDSTVFQNRDDASFFISNRMVKKEKTTIILGSGVRTDILNPDQFSNKRKSQLKNELAIRDGEIVVTMISRIIRSKGVLDFMAASQFINATHSNIRFLLVGPEDEGSLDRLTLNELTELKNSVTCTGTREDVQGILAITDIFVLPSAYREGLPRVLLEAASMGLPLITTDSPGCNETIEEGVNGFLIPIEDIAALSEALLKLIKQPQLREDFGNASRFRAVQRFDLSVVAAQTQALYNRLLSQNSKSSAIPAFETRSEHH